VWFNEKYLQLLQWKSGVTWFRDTFGGSDECVFTNVQYQQQDGYLVGDWGFGME